MIEQESGQQQRLRAYLGQHSQAELLELLLSMSADMDDLARQELWERLTPPEKAEEWIYPAPEIFLQELEDFLFGGNGFDDEDEENMDEENEDLELVAEAGEGQEDEDWENGVFQGEPDEAAVARYWAEYDDDDDDWFDDGDDRDEEIETEEVFRLEALRGFVSEANTYFQAGRYDIAAPAYQQLLAATLQAPPFAYFDDPQPLAFINEDETSFVRSYLKAQHATQPLEEFFDETLVVLPMLWTEHDHSQTFLEVVPDEQLPQLRAFLESRLETLEKQEPDFPPRLPLELKLLMELYTRAGDMGACRQLWMRFSRRYPVLYVPLLADRVQAQDWAAVLHFGAEALPLARKWRSTGRDMPALSEVGVRAQLSQAYFATGAPSQAFSVYRPVFEADPDFGSFAWTLELADAISPEHGRAFQTEVIQSLEAYGGKQRPLLCQVLLSQGEFDHAYHLVEHLHPYDGQEEVKLVAYTHLLAGLQGRDPQALGEHLQAFQHQIQESDMEPYPFLRYLSSRLPQMKLPVSSEAALERAENLLQRLMQAHIDRTTRAYYAGAALYCAMLGEIAQAQGRLVVFTSFYLELMEKYKRRYALREMLRAKVEPLLESQGGARASADESQPAAD